MVGRGGLGGQEIQAPQPEMPLAHDCKATAPQALTYDEDIWLALDRSRCRRTAAVRMRRQIPVEPIVS